MSLEPLPSLLAVLNGIRLGHRTTASEVARRLDLGQSLVGQRIKQLEDLGLVRAVGQAASTGGRSARLLVHHPAQDVVVAGVDVGVRELVVVLTTTDGKLVATSRTPSDLSRHPDAVRDDVATLLEQALEDGAVRLAAVGVSIPAPVDFATGTPFSPPAMPAWDRYPLRDALADRFGVPVDVDNDVNARLLAELRANEAAARAPSALFFYFAASVGVAVSMEGKVYRGTHGAAGEIGHTKVPNGGVAVCRCGNIGCLEALVGSDAFVRDGRLLAESGHSPALAAVLARTGTVRALDITEAAEAGDAVAGALFTRVVGLVGDTLSTLVDVYDPGLVILGGAPVRARGLLLEPIRAAVVQRASRLATQNLRIEVTQVDDGAALGAAHLALDRLFTLEHAGAVLARTRDARADR